MHVPFLSTQPNETEDVPPLPQNNPPHLPSHTYPADALSVHAAGSSQDYQQAEQGRSESPHGLESSLAGRLAGEDVGEQSDGELEEDHDEEINGEAHSQEFDFVAVGPQDEDDGAQVVATLLCILNAAVLMAYHHLAPLC